MFLFLEGARGAGKSTLLREMLLPHARVLTGFMVQRLTDCASPVGFRVVAVRGEYPPLRAEWVPGLTGVFILRGRTFPGELEQVVSQALAAARTGQYAMVLLDEIGGIELSSPVFMRPLEEIFSIGLPCIGVLKSEENLRHTARRLGLDAAELLTKHQDLREKIRQNGRLVCLRQENRQPAREAIADFLEQIRGEKFFEGFEG